MSNEIYYKLHSKQKFKKIKRALTNRGVVIHAIVAVFLLSSISPALVTADNYDEQINQLRSENQNKQNKQSALTNQAATFEDKIKGLRSQISILENQIRKDLARSNELKNRIKKAQEELAHEKSILSKSVRKMYVEDDISTLEMLASSKDLNEFVDREQYRTSVNEKIANAMEKIAKLEEELKSKKQLLEKTIADKEKRQGSLVVQRAEVAKLLRMNTKQRNALESQIANNNEEISRLRAEQAAENAALLGSGVRNVPDSTGYPWANFWPFPNEVADPWGMYLRQCVSYTAWKVASTGRYMPFWGGRGNANKWDDNARAEGIPVSYTPKAGAVGISNSGYYGHAVYVEHVYGNGNQCKDSNSCDTGLS